MKIRACKLYHIEAVNEPYELALPVAGSNSLSIFALASWLARLKLGFPLAGWPSENALLTWPWGLGDLPPLHFPCERIG